MRLTVFPSETVVNIKKVDQINSLDHFNLW